jgi:hypothetical protein
MDEDADRAFLLNSIDMLLRNEISVPEFRARYYDYYVDELPEWALSDDEEEFFGAVHEKLDWVDKTPDAESRKAGWIDHEEFKSWLRIHRDSLRGE